MNFSFDDEFIKLNQQKGSLFTEDLSTLQGRLIAIDADILVKKAEVNALKSIQEGQSALDMTLQTSIIDIINKLRDLKIEPLIVLDGLTPKYLSEEDKVLKKSQDIWDTIQNSTSDIQILNQELKNSISIAYGARYYYQEIINAAQQTNAQFFVAPYLSSPQIVYFYQEQKVHAVCGSPKIFLYECEQVIVDFDLQKKTFSFIDRDEMFNCLGMAVQEPQQQLSYLVDLFILCGALYNRKISTFRKFKINDIIKKLNEVEAKRETLNQTASDQTQTQIIAGQVLIEQEEKAEQLKIFNVEFLKIVRSFLITAPPILTTNIELGNLQLQNQKSENKNDFVYSDFGTYMGLRFNDEVYYYMSQGLINPIILETLGNQRVLPSILVAPSQTLVEAWESKEFKAFYQRIFNNLHEDTQVEKEFIADHKHNHKLSQFYEQFEFQQCEPYHLKWNLIEKDIKYELDRQVQNKVSFIFAIRWLYYELIQNQNKKTNLLKYLVDADPEIPLKQIDQVKTENEILLMTYFHYLEERGFLGQNQELLYGKLLQLVNYKYEEPVLIFLEMLKIFFPAGIDMPALDSHNDYKEKWDRMKDLDISEQDKTSILMISRIFSLVPLTSKLLQQGKPFTISDSSQLDYDLAMFGSYARKIKLLMKSMFQSIMYRLYRSGRGDISLFQKCLEMQAFNKEQNQLFGYIFKEILITLHKNPKAQDPWKHFS
eukprot:403350735